MNLHQIVRAAINVVNRDVLVTIKQSTGWTIAPDGTRSPVYVVHEDVPCQVQSLSNDELRQLDGLNIQGNKWAVYLNGDWTGVVRADGTGGDIFEFGGETWLTVTVLENWGLPGSPDSWVKLALTQQTDR